MKRVSVLAIAVLAVAACGGNPGGPTPSADAPSLSCPANISAPSFGTEVAVTYPSGLGQDVRARIVYQGPVKAPIAQGQHIADLVVSAGDMPPQVTPLVAEHAVGEAGFFGRIWAGLANLF